MPAREAATSATRYNHRAGGEALRRTEVVGVPAMFGSRHVTRDRALHPGDDREGYLEIDLLLLCLRPARIG